LLVQLAGGDRRQRPGPVERLQRRREDPAPHRLPRRSAGLRPGLALCRSANLYRVLGTEILGATLEEACLKKGRIFSADRHTIL
jgi:hypothetical protein